VAGSQIYHFAKSFSLFRDVSRNEWQEKWEELTGHKWRFPPITDYRDFSEEFGFHSGDGTGTLYGVYALLEQLGMRWYAPIPELGMVIPETKNIAVKVQDTKQEPEFPVRFFADCRVGWSIPDEFLWYKAMRVGADRFVPIYHSVSGPIEIEPEQQPQEYYGRVGGKVDYKIPSAGVGFEEVPCVHRISWIDNLNPRYRVAAGVIIICEMTANKSSMASD
jgi:hypothetical protein